MPHDVPTFLPPSSGTTLQAFTFATRILNPGQSRDGVTFTGLPGMGVLFQGDFPAGDETPRVLHLSLDSRPLGSLKYPARAIGQQFSILVEDTLYLDGLNETGQPVMLTFQDARPVVALAKGTPSVCHSATFSPLA